MPSPAAANAGKGEELFHMRRAALLRRPRVPRPPHDGVRPHIRETPYGPEDDIKRAHGAQAAVTLRYVRPLDEESWNRVVAALKRGPTPEQVKAKERLLEIALQIKSNDDDDPV